MKKKTNRPYLQLGQNISRLRKEMGLNQDDFAHKAGVAITSLKDIERGVAEGHLDTREAISKTLGCSVSDLYNDGPTKEHVVNSGIEKIRNILTEFQILEANKSLPGVIGDIVRTLSTMNEDDILRAQELVNSLKRSSRKSVKKDKRLG